MSFIEDQQKQGYKVYREHSPDVISLDIKATRKGCLIETQDDNGTVNSNFFGDECGWFYWQEGTRPIGAWFSIALVVVSGSFILPVKTQGLGGDASFISKELVLTPTIDDFEKVRAIDGVIPDTGTYGYVTQGCSQDAFELIFTPLAASVLKVDHTANSPEASSRVYDVLLGGATDPSNIGSFRDVLYVKSNKLKIWTQADFYDSVNPTHDGQLKIDATNYPTLVPPEETPFIVETKMAFDGSKWRWYTRIGGGGGATTILARVRWEWNENNNEDYSEAEAVTYDATTGYYTQTGTLYWIDAKLSKGVQFESAGDGTVFEIKKIATDFVRKNITRDLARIVLCVDDRGKTISHARKISQGSYLYCDFHNDLNGKPWTNVSNAEIKTTIGTTYLKNSSTVRIPRDWQMFGGGYNWTEINDVARGLPFGFRPVSPQLKSRIEGLWESTEIFNGETIGQYKRDL